MLVRVIAESSAEIIGRLSFKCRCASSEECVVLPAPTCVAAAVLNTIEELCNGLPFAGEIAFRQRQTKPWSVEWLVCSPCTKVVGDR